MKKTIVIRFRLQEINSQPQSMVKGLFKDDPWTQRFKELLNNRGYVAIKSLQMQGLLLVVFTKRLHLLHVREVETEYTRTGLGGMWVRIAKKMLGYMIHLFSDERRKNLFIRRVTKELWAFVLSCMVYLFA